MNTPSTGHQELDDGHARILALLEKLRYNPENLEGVVQELVERFRAHCRDEEALMRNRKFRGRTAHASEHKAILAHFSGDLLEGLRNADSHEGILEAVARAHQMLQDHIQCLDFELALHLVRKPPKRRPRKPPHNREAAPGPDQNPDRLG
jgi:hemerythrin-like metal-binding protein